MAKIKTAFSCGTNLGAILPAREPAKTSGSPRSSSLRTFRAEERRSSKRNVLSDEERGETDVFAG